MPDVQQQRTKDVLKSKIDALPPALVAEVDDFVDFVAAKRGSSAEAAKTGRSFSEPKQVRLSQGKKVKEEGAKKEPMKLNWRGALRDVSEQHTSEELRHEALEQWKKTVEHD